MATSTRSDLGSAFAMQFDPMLSHEAASFLGDPVAEMLCACRALKLQVDDMTASFGGESIAKQLKDAVAAALPAALDVASKRTEERLVPRLEAQLHAAVAASVRPVLERLLELAAPLARDHDEAAASLARLRLVPTARSTQADAPTCLRDFLDDIEVFVTREVCGLQTEVRSKHAELLPWIEGHLQAHEAELLRQVSRLQEKVMMVERGMLEGLLQLEANVAHSLRLHVDDRLGKLAQELNQNLYTWSHSVRTADARCATAKLGDTMDRRRLEAAVRSETRSVLRGRLDALLAAGAHAAGAQATAAADATEALASVVSDVAHVGEPLQRRTGSPAPRSAGAAGGIQVGSGGAVSPRQHRFSAAGQTAARSSTAAGSVGAGADATLLPGFGPSAADGGGAAAAAVAHAGAGSEAPAAEAATGLRAEAPELVPDPWPIGGARVRVLIEAANGLEAQGSGVDAYCVCEVRGQPNWFRTNVAPGSTCPVWHYRGDVVAVGTGDVLDFTVYNEDPTSTQDFLGRVSLPVSRFVDSRRFTGDLPLSGLGGGGAATLSVVIDVVA